MELRNLKTFQHAAACLNFTKTAEQLNFSQPAVTAQIQSLEQELSQSLFLRVGKKTYLTPAGEILKKYTDELFLIIDNINHTFYNLSNPNGNLTIAAYETFCTNYFPPIISEYLKNYENVNIKMFSCPSNDVIQGIESNKYDIGIISGELVRNEIENVVVADEDLVLVVSSELYQQYPVEKIVTEFPFIRYRIDGHFNDMMKAFMMESKLTPSKIIEFGSLEAIKRAVLNKIGIALISQNLVKREMMNGDLVSIRLTEKSIKVRTSLILLKEKADWATVKTFSEFVQSMWTKIHDIERLSE
ncbi:MAG: LysR family transcriptional regulator [Paenibacillus sp.]|uniref:LysR family transcriptional regulator n=1 Tax=Paenibacillus sp. TaxID=58172 RepID=UPI002903ED82|nr:LysR family transcriptional regulator [Paenibacillus sp.]MDU2240866.1 LysR family transcriptional regulator [Paenibacillus sp.]